MPQWKIYNHINENSAFNIILYNCKTDFIWTLMFLERKMLQF